MLLYDLTPAPNPWRVRIFLAEKGVEIPTVQVDAMSGATHTPEFLAKNALGELPVLELDDGSYLAESLAICRYLEGEHPDPPLFGRNATQQAFVEMWTRRVERNLTDVIGRAARHSFEFFKDRIEQFPAYADSCKRLMRQRWAWFDQEMADGRPFIAGQDFTVADIALMSGLRICDFAEEAIPDGLEHAQAWSDRVRARPSWNA